MRILVAWVSNIYERYGWQAALITLSVVASVLVGIVVATGIDLRDVMAWLEER